MKPGKDFVGVGVGVIIFNDKGELLLMKRGQGAKNERGCWTIPGGSVDFGETMVQSVVREAKEEVGLDVVVEDQITTVDHMIPNEGQHWVSTLFTARILRGQAPKNMEPHKCNEVGWFAVDALPRPLSIVTKLKIDAYFRHKEAK